MVSYHSWLLHKRLTGRVRSCALWQASSRVTDVMALRRSYHQTNWHDGRMTKIAFNRLMHQDSQESKCHRTAVSCYMALPNKSLL